MATEQTPLARAKAIALRQLASRMRTAAQIRARLAKDALEAEADAVVTWLAGLGYLDDAAYARARARSLVAPGRLGPRLAERRLAAEGIAPAAAREAIAGAVAEQAVRAREDRQARAEAGGAAPPAVGSRERRRPASGRGDDEAALCRALAERRARGQALAALDDRARSRLARFLLGRGFSGPVVSKVLGLWQDGEP